MSKNQTYKSLVYLPGIQTGEIQVPVDIMFWRTGGLATSYGYLGRGGLFELHGPSVRTAVAVKWGTKRLGLETRGLGGLEGLGQPDCPLTPAAPVSRVASQDRPPLPSPPADYRVPTYC